MTTRQGSVVLLLAAGVWASLVSSLSNAYPLFDRTTPTEERNGTVTLDANDFHRLINTLVDTVEYLKRSGTKCCQGCQPQPLMIPWMAVPLLPMNQPWYAVQSYNSEFNGLSYVAYPPISPQFAFSAQNGTLYSSKGRWVYPWPQRLCPCQGSTQQQSVTYSPLLRVMPYPEAVQQATHIQGIDVGQDRAVQGKVDLVIGTNATSAPPTPYDILHVTTYEPGAAIPTDIAFTKIVETTMLPHSEPTGLEYDVETAESIDVTKNVQNNNQIDMSSIGASTWRQQTDLGSTTESSFMVLSEHPETESPATEHVIFSESFASKGITQNEFLVAYTKPPVESFTAVIYETTTPSQLVYTESLSLVNIEEASEQLLYTETQPQPASTERVEVLTVTEAIFTVPSEETISSETDVYTTVAGYEAAESTEMTIFDGIHWTATSEKSQNENAYIVAISEASSRISKPQVIAIAERPRFSTEMIDAEVQYSGPTTELYEMETSQIQIAMLSTTPPPAAPLATEVFHGETEVYEYKVEATEPRITEKDHTVVLYTDSVTDVLDMKTIHGTIPIERTTKLPPMDALTEIVDKEAEVYATTTTKIFVTTTEQPETLLTEVVTATYTTDVLRTVMDLVQPVEVTTGITPEQLSEVFSTEWTVTESNTEFIHSSEAHMKNVIEHIKLYRETAQLDAEETPTASRTDDEAKYFTTSSIALEEITTEAAVEALPSTNIVSEMVATEVIFTVTSEIPSAADSADTVEVTEVGEKLASVMVSTTSGPKVSTADIEIESDHSVSTEIVTAETVASVPLWLNRTSVRHPMRNNIVPVELMLTASETPKTDADRLQLIGASFSSDNISNTVESFGYDTVPHYSVVRALITPSPQSQFVIWSPASSVQPIQDLTWTDDISRFTIGATLTKPLSSYSSGSRELLRTYTVPAEPMTLLSEQWTPSGEIHASYAQTIPGESVSDDSESNVSQDEVNIDLAYPNHIRQGVSPPMDNFASVEEVTFIPYIEKQSWHQYPVQREPSSIPVETVNFDPIDMRTPPEAPTETRTLEMDIVHPKEVAYTPSPQADATDYEIERETIENKKLQTVPAYIEVDLPGAVSSTDFININSSDADRTELEAPVRHAYSESVVGEDFTATSMPFVSAVTTANNNLGIEASTVAEMSTEVANVDELFSTKHVEVYSVDTTPESFAAVGITETQTVPTRYGRETSSALTSIEVFDTDMISRLNLSKVTPNESIAGFPTVTVTTDWVDAGSTDKLENSTKNISQKSSTEVVQADAIVSAPFSTIEEMPLSTAEDAVMHLRSHFYAENLQRSAEDLKEGKTIDTLELDNSNQFDDLDVRSAEEVDTSTEVTTKAHSVTVSPFAIADSVNQSFDFSLGQVPESSPSPDWLTAFITVMRTTTPATEASSLEQISYRTPTANKDLTQVMNDYDYEDQTVDNSSTMDFTTTDSSETEESLWHMESYEDYMQPIAMVTLESSARDESSEVRVASTDKAYLTYEQNYPAKIEKNTSENSNTVTAKIVVTPEVKEIPEPAVPTDQRDSLAAYTMPTNTKLTPRGIPVDSKTETPIPTSNGMAIVDETEVISTSEDRPSSSTQFPIYLGAEYASTTMFPEKASDQGTIASIDMNYSGRDRTEAEYSGQTISSELHGSRDIRTESTMTEFGEVDYRGFTDKPDESFAFSSALQPTHKTQSDTTVKASSSSDVEFLLDGIGSPQPRSSIEETRPKEQESLPAKIDYSDEKEPLASNTVATEIVPKITDRVQSQPSYIEAENTLTLTDSSIHQEEWVKSHRITTSTWQESTSAKNIPFESFTSITESTALTDGVPTLDMFLPMSDHKIGVSSELQTLRPKLIELKPTTGTINRSEWPLLGAVTAQSSVEVDNEFYQTSSESLYGLELRDRPSDVDRSALSTDSSAQSPLYDVITEVTQIYKNTSLRNTSTENEQQAIEERQAQLATSLNINQEMYEVTSNGIGIDGADSTVIGDSSTNPPHNRYMSSSSVQSYGSNDDMGLPERDGKLPIENADYAISMTGLPRLENAVLYRSTTGPVQRADRKLVISNIKPSTSLTLQRSVEENTPDAALQIAQVEPATVEPFGSDDDVTLPILSNGFYDAANYPLPRRENFYTTEGLPLPKTDLATGAGLNNEAIVPDRRTITPFVSKSVEESNTLPPTEVAFDERIEEGKQWSRYQDRPIREPDEARLGLIESVVEASPQNKVLLRGAAPNSWPQEYSSTVAPDTDSRRESAEEFLEYDLDGEGKNSTPQNNDKAKIVIEQSVHLPAVKMFDVIIPPVQTVSSLRQSGVTVSSGKPVPRQHWQSAKNEILRHLSELDEHVRLGQANITGETSRLAAHMLRRHLANMSDTLQNSAIPPRLHTDNERQKQFDTIYSNLSLSIQGLNLTSNDAERAERLVASARASIQLARELILILADGSNDAESRIVIEQILSYARLMLLEVINSIRASSDKSALGLGHADLLSWEWLLGRTSRRQYVFSRVFSAKPHIFDAQIYRSANQ